MGVSDGVSEPRGGGGDTVVWNMSVTVLPAPSIQVYICGRAPRY